MLLCRLCVLFSFLSLPLSLAAESARLVAEADPAHASILPGDRNSGALRLPALAYRIGVEARCRNGDRAESLSISVADTRTTLPGDMIADTTNITVDITIPSNQVAPLPTDGFCLLDGGDDRELLVEDAFSAHVSLRCSGDEGESITYASRPLAVVLTCVRDPQGDSEPSILR